MTEMEWAVGGGSLPGATARVDRTGRQSGQARTAWRPARTGEGAVVGRVESGAVLLDLRTIEPSDDGAPGVAMARALAAHCHR